MDVSTERYDRIGATYGSTRQPDPRVHAQLLDVIGDAQRILNVGAGTGNYEPVDRPIVAVEPSATMVAQRAVGSAPVVRAGAESLPVRSDAFDVATAWFTVHHWDDQAAGLRELARVAPRQVLLVYDVAVSMRMWLLDYSPEIATAPWEVDAPSAASIGAHLDVIEERALLVPPDCTDGFSAAFWNRPERYLDPEVQAGMSTMSRLDPGIRERGSERLRAALDDGTWEATHGHLRGAASYDAGYRIVSARRR